MKNLVIVMIGPLVQFVEHLLHSIGICHRTNTIAKRGANHTTTGQQLVFVEHSCPTNRIKYQFKIRIFQFIGYQTTYCLCLFYQLSPLGNALSYLLLAIVDEPNMCVFASSLQLIITSLNVGNILCQRTAKGFRCPIPDVIIRMFGLPTVDVPS